MFWNDGLGKRVVLPIWTEVELVDDDSLVDLVAIVVDDDCNVIAEHRRSS
jgi:hypothetical protein